MVQMREIQENRGFYERERERDSTVSTAVDCRNSTSSFMATGWRSLGLATSAGPSLHRGSDFPSGRTRIRGLGDFNGSRMRSLAVVNSGGTRGTPSEGEESWLLSEAATPYQVLGIDPSCSPSQLKDAFRSRVKEFHPDVCKDIEGSDAIIRRVIQAYEVLSKYHQFEDPEGDSSDPFEKPECEAVDIFVNEILCLGKACSYSCVKRAPHAFSYSSSTGAAYAISKGQSEDYQVQLAIGQCPRRCIHYVTPSQRSILEELLHGILNSPYDEAEVAVLDALIQKARFENNRYEKPKRKPKESSKYADFF